MCLDASKGCDQTCRKRSFNFLIRKNGIPNPLNFTCCLCNHPRSQELESIEISNPPAVCPYDPNCRSPFSCGAYLAKVSINGVILDCQKCQICDPPINDYNIDIDPPQ